MEEEDHQQHQQQKKKKKKENDEQQEEKATAEIETKAGATVSLAVVAEPPWQWQQQL